MMAVDIIQIFDFFLFVFYGRKENGWDVIEWQYKSEVALQERVEIQ